MAEDVDQPCVKDSVFVVIVAFDARGEVPVAVKACGLFKDCAKHVEVMGIQPAIPLRLVELGQRGHMVKPMAYPRSGAGEAPPTIRPGRESTCSPWAARCKAR